MHMNILFVPHRRAHETTQDPPPSQQPLESEGIGGSVESCDTPELRKSWWSMTRPCACCSFELAFRNGGDDGRVRGDAETGAGLRGELMDHSLMRTDGGEPSRPPRAFLSSFGASLPSFRTSLLSLGFSLQSFEASLPSLGFSTPSFGASMQSSALSESGFRPSPGSKTPVPAQECRSGVDADSSGLSTHGADSELSAGIATEAAAAPEGDMCADISGIAASGATASGAAAFGVAPRADGVLGAPCEAYSCAKAACGSSLCTVRDTFPARRHLRPARLYLGDGVTGAGVSAPFSAIRTTSRTSFFR